MDTMCGKRYSLNISMKHGHHRSGQSAGNYGGNAFLEREIMFAKGLFGTHSEQKMTLFIIISRFAMTAELLINISRFSCELFTLFMQEFWVFLSSFPFSVVPRA